MDAVEASVAEDDDNVPFARFLDEAGDDGVGSGFVVGGKPRSRRVFMSRSVSRRSSSASLSARATAAMQIPSAEPRASGGRPGRRGGGSCSNAARKGPEAGSRRSVSACPRWASRIAVGWWPKSSTMVTFRCGHAAHFWRRFTLRKAATAVADDRGIDAGETRRGDGHGRVCGRCIPRSSRSVALAFDGEGGASAR